MDRSPAPEALALWIARRARDAPRYQMGAVIVDARGHRLAWGWCWRGAVGRSMHAEAHALTRANRARLPGSTIWIAGIRKGTGRVILARPCATCAQRILVNGLARVVYSTPTGWREEWV
jgi:tRNA(Arg) A34 adenosine deaminase TadA